MTNNLAALRPKLLERFNYDPKTGHFTHKRTALPYHHAGQRAEKQSATDLVLRHDGLHLSCKRVAWLFVTGEWPAGHLTYRDGNPANVSFENLVAVSEVSRGRRTRNCKHCGAAYVAQRVDATAKYCSRACAVAAADKPIPAEVPCKRCGEVLPRGEFPVNGHRIGRVCTPCLREHARHRRLADRYGLTVAGLEAIIAAQGGRCAICGEAPDTGPQVDHDHATGAVRGVLCTPCNTGLGHFRDSGERLLSAAAYLAKHAQSNKPLHPP